jgi:nicotinamidase-related amidase
MTSALIIIDMQTAAFEPAAVPKYDASGTIARINRLAGDVRAARGSVLFIQHDGPPGDAFEPGAPGWQLWPALDRKAADLVVRKTSCDSFLGTTLDATLRDRTIDWLIITGWATDYCVDTTVRAALARGWPTTVPADGHTCADRPHLPASKIIEHHNAIWADFVAPRGPAMVQPCATIRLST